MVDEQPDPTRSMETSSAEPPFDIVWRGFDQEQVLEHLKRVGDTARDLESRFERTLRELAEARLALDSAGAADRDPYEGVSTHVMDLVDGFDREVEQHRRKAELEATGIMAQARTEAARMRLDAQAAEEQMRTEAERLLREAQDEAESVRAELAPLREWTLSRAQALRDHLQMSLLELEAILPGESDEQRVIVLEEASEVQSPSTSQPGAPPAP